MGKMELYFARVRYTTTNVCSGMKNTKNRTVRYEESCNREPTSDVKQFETISYL